MQLGRRVRVRAGSGVPTSDPNYAQNQPLFAGTIAQNGALNGRIALPEALAAGRNAMGVIRNIEVVSVDGNIWEFWFWANSKFQIGGSTAPGETFRGAYAFAAAGKQIGATGLFYADAAAPVDIFYEDDDAMTAQGAGGVAATNQQVGAYLNVTLINRSAGAKTANGWFDVTFVLEPCLGW